MFCSIWFWFWFVLAIAVLSGYLIMKVAGSLFEINLIFFLMMVIYLVFVPKAINNLEDIEYNVPKVEKERISIICSKEISITRGQTSDFESIFGENQNGLPEEKLYYRYYYKLENGRY